MSSFPPLRERWRNHQSPHVDGHVSEDHRQQITSPHKECCGCQPSNKERDRWPCCGYRKCHPRASCGNFGVVLFQWTPVLLSLYVLSLLVVKSFAPRR